MSLPDTIEGYRIGARTRESGVLAVHAGTSRLDLPVDVFLAQEAALTGGFEADDFVAGVRRAAAVHHEALLPFVTGGRVGEFVFAISKSVAGSTLEEVVAKDGPLSEGRALALAAAIAGALAALERGGMRHGDLSPQRMVAPIRDSFVVGPPRLLPASLAPRADRWQAPEEARGGENGVQSDLFVLGLLIVYAMTGEHPLGAAADARRALRDWKTPDMIAILRRASPETRALVAKLLAPEPSKRFATAAEALQAIEDAANSRPETAPVGGAGVPTVRPLAEPPKRSPGRLYVQARLGEAMLELDDDAVYVGSNPANNIRAQSETFPEAALRVERTAESDVVHAMGGDLKVNGRPVQSQALADGDRVLAPGITARYERAARSALRASGGPGAGAPAANPLAGAITAVAVLGTIATLAWGTWRVMAMTKESADAKAMAARAEQRLGDDPRHRAATDPIPPAPSAAAPAGERAARDAYESAAQAARRRPNEARAQYYAVWQRFPDTAYGLLACLDAHEIDRRTKPVPDAALERLLAAAEAPDASADDETMSKLRSYLEDHPGTLAGERAHVALVRSQARASGRFDADMATIRAAIANRDWREAKLLIDKVNEYVPLNLKDQVLAELHKIEQGMSESQRGGASRSPDGPGGKPKDGPAKAPEADRNRKAEEIFRNGRRLMDGGKDAEALDAFLIFLREYKDTPNGAKYDPEVRGRINTLSTGPAGIIKLFRGKVEKVDNKGRWRVTYDFEDPAQFQDFRDIPAFEAPPRAGWKIEGGAVRASRGAGALVLDAVFGSGDISTSVSVTTDVPHDLGILYMDPAEQRRFYLFTLQNTFFKLGLGAAAKAFNENAIVLFGPNMWRDTPPGQLGFVRKCGSDEPIVRPSEATPIKGGKAGDEVWMKFEGGRSIRGSAYGDVKYEWPQGITPGLFVLGSTGFFDDFVVEGTLDMDWVQTRWRAILSGL